MERNTSKLKLQLVRHQAIRLRLLPEVYTLGTNMKSLLTLFIAMLMIASTSAQDPVELGKPDGKILSFVKELSESHANFQSYISRKTEWGLAGIINIDVFKNNQIMIQFTTFSTIGLLERSGNGSRGEPTQENPKIGEDAIGIPEDKIENLKKFTTSKGLHFSEQWTILKDPNGKAIGSRKDLKIYSSTSKTEVNSEIITYIITGLYGFKIADCQFGSVPEKMKIKP